MTRLEFGRPVRREALRRSGGMCEAVGQVYGLQAGQRCNAPLSHGVEFDHYPLRAADGGGNGLDNCAAVCPTCHRIKTSTFDTPMAAKGKRISDRHVGIKDKSKWPTQRLGNGNRQHSATRPLRSRNDLRTP